MTIVAMVRDSAMTSLTSSRFFTELSINSYSNQVFFPSNSEKAFGVGRWIHKSAKFTCACDCQRMLYLEQGRV